MEIENFIHERALDFVHRKLAVTYFVLDTDGECAAYFTLANKALDFPSASMSQSTRKRIERYSKFNEQSGSYIVPAFLLDFYQNNHNGFHLFGERKSDSGTMYKLLYKFI